jgi:hypothetical protein
MYYNEAQLNKLCLPNVSFIEICRPINFLKLLSVLLNISGCATLLLQVKLGRLPLNAHVKDKLLRLVGERYNPENDVLTIMTDRCPLRQQNLDYALYLLTTLFYESWVSVPHLFYLAPVLLIPSSSAVRGFFQF